MSADGRDSLVTNKRQLGLASLCLPAPVYKGILDDLLCFVSFPAAVLEGSRDLSFLHDDITFPEHELAKPRKIIELRDKQARDTNSRCVVCIRWIGVGGCFGPRVEEQQTARVKENQKFKNIARFEISSKRRLAMQITALDENTREASKIISQGERMQEEGPGHSGPVPLPHALPVAEIQNQKLVRSANLHKEVKKQETNLASPKWPRVPKLDVSFRPWGRMKAENASWKCQTRSTILWSRAEQVPKLKRKPGNPSVYTHPFLKSRLPPWLQIQGTSHGKKLGFGSTCSSRGLRVSTRTSLTDFSSGAILLLGGVVVAPSNSPRGALVPHLDDVVEVVAQRDKEVKVQFAALSSLLHLGLHGARPLEGLAAPDDQCQVVGAQAAVRVRGMGVAVLGRTQDGAHVDARLQPLLPQRQPLQLLQPVPLGRAVDHRVPEEVFSELILGDAFGVPPRRVGTLSSSSQELRYSRTAEKTSGSSSGSAILLDCAYDCSRYPPFRACSKNGLCRRTSSWAANSRPSMPTVNVTMGDGARFALEASCGVLAESAFNREADPEASRSVSDRCSFDNLPRRLIHTVLRIHGRASLLGVGVGPQALEHGGGGCGDVVSVVGGCFDLDPSAAGPQLSFVLLLRLFKFFRKADLTRKPLLRISRCCCLVLGVGWYQESDETNENQIRNSRDRKNDGTRAEKTKANADTLKIDGRAREEIPLIVRNDRPAQ
ncbi:hypothetical protein FJTKL_14528 [Diaporthe vaccinii]|uniref:Uncharacterized protein n=1 Tax=Diaporthe vaccinii TaxID=105482 RepID=A0ABR4E771_9PEZI